LLAFWLTSLIAQLRVPRGGVGRQGWKKCLRELVNLYSSVNYEEGSGSVSHCRGKGRGIVFYYEVQYPYLEYERAKLSE
jgi:hypothetical protein